MGEDDAIAGADQSLRSRAAVRRAFASCSAMVPFSPARMRELPPTAMSMVFIRLNRLHPYTCANSLSSARSGSFTTSPFISSSMMAFCA